MKGKILYLLVICATIYLGILYYSPAFLGVAAVEVMFPLLSFGILQWQAKKCRGEIYCSLRVAEKNQKISVGIAVENRCWMPLASLKATLEVKNTFYQPVDVIILQGMACGKGKTRIETELYSERCGLLQLQIKNVYLYDMLRLFKKQVHIKDEQYLSIMPELYIGSIHVSDQTRMYLSESEEYDKQQPGDDPSEVFQIREYRGGDRLQSIHWKLSARTETLMVKEYSRPLTCAVIVFLDLGYRKEEGYGVLDEFFEAGLAISQGLLETETEHMVVWYDEKKQTLCRVEIREKDDIYWVIEQIFQAEPYTECVELSELYRENYRNETEHTTLLLNLKKELWKNGELQEVLEGHAREFLEHNEVEI